MKKQHSNHTKRLSFIHSTDTNSERGVALLELAIALPLMLLILAVIIEILFYSTSYLKASTIVRDGIWVAEGLDPRAMGKDIFGDIGGYPLPPTTESSDLITSNSSTEDAWAKYFHCIQTDPEVPTENGEIDVYDFADCPHILIQGKLALLSSSQNLELNEIYTGVFHGKRRNPRNNRFI